jgi:carboxymethylenebutenolidase
MKKILGDYINLTASDSFEFPAYVATPIEPARAAVVILQEMDQRLHGESSHTGGRPTRVKAERFKIGAPWRAVAEKFAAMGYLAVVPSTYNRGVYGADFGYRHEFNGSTRGWHLVRPVEPMPTDKVMLDIQAAINHAQLNTLTGGVGLLGYCWGGLLAWRAANQLDGVSAAVSYYGGGMTLPDDARRQPMCPVMAHFPRDKRWISEITVGSFVAQQPAVESYVYDARYGFNAERRQAYDAPAARLALERTLGFLSEHLLALPDQATGAMMAASKSLA